MATAKFNSKSPTIRRILKEAAELSNSPSPDYAATPLESDLFEWHFTLRGPPNSSFAEGMYHGRIVLPPTYPLRPPSFRFTTPSGRFEANREICLSISGHHEETWQPAWGIRTALVALRSFMETDPAGQIGGLNAAHNVRVTLAGKSRAWTCQTCGVSNEEILREVEERAKKEEEEGGEGKRNRDEVEVPAELKMGFRDEMEAATKKANGGSSGEADADDADDAESAQLAEGFVQTVRRERLPSEEVATSALPARPAQRVPAPTAPTRTVPLPPDPLAQATAQRARNLDPNAGVPVWIDYAIITLVGMLVAMLVKTLLRY